MVLRRDANLSAFMDAIQTCRGGIFYDTAEGDHLNLKSTLSQFVFISVAAGDRDGLDGLNGQIICQDEEDLPLLLPFLN